MKASFKSEGHSRASVGLTMTRAVLGSGTWLEASWVFTDREEWIHVCALCMGCQASG